MFDRVVDDANLQQDSEQVRELKRQLQEALGKSIHHGLKVYSKNVPHSQKPHLDEGKRLQH